MANKKNKSPLYVFITVLVIIAFMAFFFLGVGSEKVKEVTLSINPETQKLTKGSTSFFNVSADILEKSTQAYEIVLTFNPSIIQVKNITSTECPVPVSPAPEFDNSIGKIYIARGCTDVKSGKFNLANVEFNVIGLGQTDVSISNESKIISTGDYQPIDYSIINGQINAE